VAEGHHIELDELIAAKGQVAADKAKETTNNIFLPFFLTKYSAIIAEMKGYFGIEIGLECAC
jgi:hypothetical protein